MASTFTAFFDANVFYGARLRSLMLFVAQTKLFRARWSEEVHREWIDRLLAGRPDLTRESLERTRRAMDAAVLDAVVTGYGNLIDAVTLPDPDDRHVLAAAVACRASCIVTFNLGDFPTGRLSPFGLHAVHPDDFLLDVESIDPAAFADAVRDDFQHYQRPALVFGDYVSALKKAGVPKVAGQIEQLAVLIDAPPPTEPGTGAV